MTALLAGEQDLFAVCPDEASAAAFAADLSFFLSSDHILPLPPPENQPYEGLVPEPGISAARIKALYGILSGSGPVVASAASLAYPVPAATRLAQWQLTLEAGRYFDREEKTAHLVAMGYRRRPVAIEPGTFAVRGGIMDIFSPGMDHPVRIELWDDDIRSIRSFDTDTQRSQVSLDEAVIYPVSEMPLPIEERTAMRQKLQELMLEAALPSAERQEILDRWDEQLPLPGEQLYMPLLTGNNLYPLDLIPHTTTLLILEPENCRREMISFSEEAARRRDGRFPAPDKLFAPPESTWARIMETRRVEIGEVEQDKCRRVHCTSPLPDTLPGSRSERLKALNRLAGDKGSRTVLAARSDTAADRLLNLMGDTGGMVTKVRTFGEADVHDGPSIVTGPLSSGFSFPEEGLTVVSDSDLFGKVRTVRRSRATIPDWDLPIGSLEDGDIVVHIDHGIGRYDGLRQLEIAGATDDFLHIAFAGDDSLYVPVWEMNRVQRYRSSSEADPPLSKLGSAGWKKAKTRIRRSLRMMAEELLKVSAARKEAVGHGFSEPETLYREFEASFPWEETADQENSINEVVADMTSSRPMDRLVCGDVGFGKTEVAMRAAFLAAADGKQTAVLVPTTVLAQQHYQTFTERLAEFPVRVGLISRFVTAARQEAVLDQLKNGEIDIIIGTHRLLSGDIEFADLGLLVIDEEHRFGVQHKEKLKKLRKTVDVLTLSATPIPRTLFQAFSGLRSLSLIHTPPADRKSVHTEIRYYDEALLRDAILREMDRGGQVYVVHNRVQTIEAFAGLLKKLCPEAVIGIAHGQMGERELEQVMVSFMTGDFDVLVSTAIVESGLDITNANTLIVNRADRFGLAQLYQLRGRVGRSSALGYAYLLIPSESGITRQARQRLRRLRELAELGSGFKLATFDLEMRGAGNLLGAEQSGRIDSVGIDLYSQLLEQAVREAAGQVAQVEVDPSITLPLPSFLPEEYLPDVGERLTLYKRIANLADDETLERLQEEAADRFGRLPGPVKGLFTRSRVVIFARKLGIERIDTAGPYFMVGFHPEARISPDVLVALLTRDERLSFLPPTTLRMDVSSLTTPDDRVQFLMETLRSL
jgi:transcription-repair coupling factor (superfamily II helicase)